MRALILALVLAFAVVRVDAADIPKPVINWFESNVVHVEVLTGSGSGFFIEPDLIMTACHVVIDEPYIWISKQGYLNRYTGELVACDQARDIGLIKITEQVPGTVPTIFADHTPRAGKQTYGGGYPFSLPLIISEGNYQRESPFGGGAVMDSAHVLPGDSGGPLVVYVDEEVRVVGVRTAVLRVGEGEDKVLFPNIGFISPLNQIKEVLSEYFK